MMMAKIISILRSLVVLVRLILIIMCFLPVVPSKSDFSFLV